MTTDLTDPLDDWFRAELAATMRPCPEYRESQRKERKPKARTPRSPCPACGITYTRSYLPEHVARIHSQDAGNGGENVDRGAA